MIGEIGFLGSLLQFVGKRLLGGKIDIVFDKRKRLCKSFLQLHNGLVDLEHVCADVASMIEPIAEGKKDRLFTKWLNDIADRITQTTIDVQASLFSFQPALKILDPELSVLLTGLQSGKKALSERATKAFNTMLFKVEWKEGRRGYKCIKITITGLNPAEIDWAEHISLASSSLYRRKSLTDSSKHPDYLAELVDGTHHVVKILPTDIDTITDFYLLLQDHIKILADARKVLAQFIKKSFSIEDVLRAHGA